jgi:tetratricopeptide (TPR) repeat protein
MFKLDTHTDECHVAQFENGIRINRKKIQNWTRYAEWEASQNEFERARSIMERSLDEDYQNPVLWLKYAELEMQQKNINHARNVFDRAVALLPRQAQIWLRYVFMEGGILFVMDGRFAVFILILIFFFFLLEKKRLEIMVVVVWCLSAGSSGSRKKWHGTRTSSSSVDSAKSIVLVKFFANTSLFIQRF